LGVSVKSKTKSEKSLKSEKVKSEKAISEKSITHQEVMVLKPETPYVDDTKIARSVSQGAS